MIQARANAVYTENFNDVITKGKEGWGYPSKITH